MTKNFAITFFFMILLASEVSSQQLFDYQNQDLWAGQCQTGKRQSPINIDEREQIIVCPNWGYEYIMFMDEYFEENITRDDYGMEDIGDGYIFYYEEKDNVYESYKTSNMHWHTSSEHLINGQSFSAELAIDFEPIQWTDLPDKVLGPYADLDFSNISNEYQTAGSSIRFLFYEDDSIETDVFDNLMVDEDNVTHWNLNKIFGQAIKNYFYIYRGSRTTPDDGEQCQQIIWHFVSQQPLPIKPSTLGMINEKINYPAGQNHRKIQGLNDRIIYLSGAPCELL